MKKRLLVIFAGIFMGLACSYGVQANEGMDFSTPSMQSFLLEGASARALVYKPVWEKLNTCERGKTSDGVLQILGITPDRKCHFIHAKYDCRLPLSLTKQYAAAGIRSLEQIADGNLETTTEEDSFMEKIHSNPEYCTAK